MYTLIVATKPRFSELIDHSGGSNSIFIGAVPDPSRNRFYLVWMTTHVLRAIERDLRSIMPIADR
jgi:hypothetical protein